jgi:DNA-directed RNA polymerase sigma subunit (sigma70/sigma32)
MPFTYKERNREMHRLRTERAMTLTAIGKKYGVTRERVRVIVNKIEEENANKNIQDIRTTRDGENDSTTE